MSQQQQGQSSNDDTIILGLFGAAIALMVLMAVLNAQQGNINAVLGAIAWVHVAPFALLGQTLSTVPGLPALPFLPDTVVVEHFLASNRYAGMSAEQRDLVLAVAGRCASILYVPAIAFLAFFGTKFRPDRVFREKPTLDSMIALQSGHWKTLRPVRLTNPAKMNDVTAGDIANAIGERRLKLPALPSKVLVAEAPAYKAPDWGRALRPEEWLVAQGLTHDQDSWLAAKKDGGTKDAGRMAFQERWLDVDLDGAIELLSAQLTHQWRGFANLRPYQRALCAVFALFFDYQNSKGERILNELAVLYAAKGKASMDDLIRGEKELYARVAATLDSPVGQALAKQAAGHAWLQTAMVRMLSVARKDRGVLAAAQFNWLKAEDRSLWYALCNTGGDAFMIEAAGVFAHFKAEMQIGLPLRRPAVYQAARSLIEDYLDMRPERVQKREQRAEDSKSVATRFREALAGSQQETAEEERMAAEAEAAANKGKPA